MKKMASFGRKLPVILLVLLLMLGCIPIPAGAQEPRAVEIRTPEELAAMAEDPSGSYILMADLDMSGIEWKSLDFSGIFDGNGHAILNLTVTQPGDEKPNSYDGNNKGYETTYYGLFATLRNASVKNLRLLNVRSVVQSDTPTFLAGIAGYADHSTVTDCEVTGTLELRAHDRMFGIAGIIGHGNGSVERCRVDVTLICTDTDAATRDEQFLGGVFATGFVNVIDCEIVIDGYASEHGYAHTGGIAGMYMRYPLEDWKTTGYITGNSVTGKITFFEDNRDRRAYCEGEVGEPLASNVEISGNAVDFLRDERFVYDRELRPELCEAPAYTETLVASTCMNYGYTVFSCTGCGYTYRDRYTLLSDHTSETWQLAEPPTEEREGLSTAGCDWCGIGLERTEPKLEPETQPETVPETAPADGTEDAAENGAGLPWAAIGAGVIGCGGAVLLSARLRKKKK